MSDAEFTAFVNRQVVILYDSDTFKTFRGLPYDVYTFFIREESPLVYIDSDSDGHLIEHGQCPFEDIKMSCRERIERSRK